MKKIKRLICKIFGHSFNPIKFCMFEIEMKAINSNQLQPKIQCGRCKKVWRKP